MLVEDSILPMDLFNGQLRTKAVRKAMDLPPHTPKQNSEPFFLPCCFLFVAEMLSPNGRHPRFDL
jgi:hypothetical protein